MNNVIGDAMDSGYELGLLVWLGIGVVGATGCLCSMGRSRRLGIGLGVASMILGLGLVALVVVPFSRGPAGVNWAPVSLLLLLVGVPAALGVFAVGIGLCRDRRGRHGSSDLEP